MNNFWEDLKKPIKVLAPMAGYTDASFRLLCHQFGADVTMSELVSADAIAYDKKLKVESEEIFLNVCHPELVSGSTKEQDSCSLDTARNDNEEQHYTLNRVTGKNESTANLLSFFEEERPFVVQLFGKHPENFAKAAKWMTEELKPDGIDINMGCPARKVVGSDHGAALLKNPELAVEIIRAVCESTNLPVSVKTRLGWDNDDQILEFAPKVAEAGASAIIIHGRTYKDGFKNKARWANIYAVKEMMGDGIVVIGNGDLKTIPKSEFQITNEIDVSVISTPQSGWRNLQQDERSLDFVRDDNQYPLDGFAIGRATFGKPWIFRENSKVKTQNSKLSEESILNCHPELVSGSNMTESRMTDPEISLTELKNVILKQAMLAFGVKGEHGIVEFRKHLLAYLVGFPGARELRKQAVLTKSFDDIKGILNSLSL